MTERLKEILMSAVRWNLMTISLQFKIGDKTIFDEKMGWIMFAFVNIFNKEEAESFVDLAEDGYVEAQYIVGKLFIQYGGGFYQKFGDKNSITSIVATNLIRQAAEKGHCTAASELRFQYGILGSLNTMILLFEMWKCIENYFDAGFLYRNPHTKNKNERYIAVVAWKWLKHFGLWNRIGERNKHSLACEGNH